MKAAISQPIGKRFDPSTDSEPRRFRDSALLEPLQTLSRTGSTGCDTVGKGGADGSCSCVRGARQLRRQRGALPCRLANEIRRETLTANLERVGICLSCVLANSSYLSSMHWVPLELIGNVAVQSLDHVSQVGCSDLTRIVMILRL